MYPPAADRSAAPPDQPAPTQPPLRARLAQAWSRSPHTVSRRLRTYAAALLALTGVGLLILPDSRDTPTQVEVVALSRDLLAGEELTADSLVLVTRPSAQVPAASVRTLDEALGARLTAAGRSGEILTDFRLRRVQTLPDHRVITLTPADTAAIDAVRPGDVVDVLALPTEDFAPVPSAPELPAGPEVLARDAVVVAVNDADQGSTRGERSILIHLLTDAAERVAAASLSRSLTIVIH